MRLGLIAVFVLPLCAVPAAADPIMLSVKLVKPQAVRCTSAPSVQFLTEAAAWRLVDKPYHHGENDWEIFYEIETDAARPPLAEVAITAPGVKAARVLVGKTDVPFRQEGDQVRFRLVADRSAGQSMQVLYRSPRGGYPIYFLHNWEMRRAERYAAGPYPAKQVDAVKNYLLAAQELLRVMGDMGPEKPKPFRGEVVLMDSEIAATRGHKDYPAHVHIMHYQFEPGANGKQEWVSRLVPHLYMDDRGCIARNSYAVLAGRGKSGELKAGDVCRFEDTQGTPVLNLIIDEGGGLILQRPGGERYSLRPDPERGPAFAVYGYRGEQALFRVEAQDDAAKGDFHYQIDTLWDAKVIDTFRDGYRYDPFTAKVLGKPSSAK